MTITAPGITQQFGAAASMEAGLAIANEVMAPNAFDNAMAVGLGSIQAV